MTDASSSITKTDNYTLDDSGVFSFENFSMVPFNPNSQEDYEHYKAIVCDEEIMKTVSLFNKKTPTEEEAKKSYFDLTEVNKISDAPLSYRIMTKNGDMMGFVMMAVLEKNSDGMAAALDFGGLFRRQYRGGAALIASSVLLKRCFSSKNINKLLATALSDNYNPQAILLRLGFEFVGQVQKGEDGKPINVFELSRKKFCAPDYKPAKIKNIREYIDNMPSMTSSSKEFHKPFCLSDYK